MAQNLILDIKLNRDGYNYNNAGGGIVDGWTRIEVKQYAPDPSGSGSNFAAQLYQNPDGTYKIAYRGTKDWGSGDRAMNAAIGTGRWSSEMSESVRFTYQAIQQVARERGFEFAEAAKLFSLTGHSQGGFEAELNAKFFGLGGTSNAWGTSWTAARNCSATPG